MSSRPLTFREWQRAGRPTGTHSKPPSHGARAVHPILPVRASDPPSLRPVPSQAPIFDPAPHRNKGMIACPELAPGLTNRVIATAVAFGMPRREAEEARVNPYVRAHVAMLACMVWDAAAGDKPAKRALERIAFAFGNRGNIAEMLDAHEQPADSGELTKLLGLD